MRDRRQLPASLSGARPLAYDAYRCGRAAVDHGGPIVRPLLGAPQQLGRRGHGVDAGLIIAWPDGRCVLGCGRSTRGTSRTTAARIGAHILGLDEELARVAFDPRFSDRRQVEAALRLSIAGQLCWRLLGDDTSTQVAVEGHFIPPFILEADKLNFALIDRVASAEVRNILFQYSSGQTQ